MSKPTELDRKITELLRCCSSGESLSPINSVRVLKALQHATHHGCATDCPSCRLVILDLLNGVEDDS